MNFESEIFRKVNKIGEKRNSKKKTQRFGREGFNLCGKWKLYRRERHEITKKKGKVYLIEKNEKRSEQWGEEIRVPTSE